MCQLIIDQLRHADHGGLPPTQFCTDGFCYCRRKLALTYRECQNHIFLDSCWVLFGKDLTSKKSFEIGLRWNLSIQDVQWLPFFGALFGLR